MSSQSLPGNPHEHCAVEAECQSCATLALAYEVRTQTLVTLHQGAMQLLVNDKARVDDEQLFVGRMNEINAQIEDRLGLDKENNND